MPPADRPSGVRPGDAVSLARALSKLGACSRREAERRVRDGRVRVNDRVVDDPAARVDPRRDRIAVDGQRVRAAAPLYLAVHKPRGVVTSHVPERGAPTVYELLPPAYAGRHLAAVGRLDKASEGLLLVTNDTRWAARVLDPAAHVPKRYHVHVRPGPGAPGAPAPGVGDALLEAVREGVPGEPGEWLAAPEARVLRAGTRTAWLELVLDEGRNRHIRRLLASLDVEVERLIRVAIGPLALGDLPAGAVRPLTPGERDALTGAGQARPAGALTTDRSDSRPSAGRRLTLPVPRHP